MQLIQTIAQMRLWRGSVDTVALVPTMGNLHQGHLMLVREAKKRAGAVVVSIFVNRLQFVEGEDFDQYPRTLQDDMDKLSNEGVDVVFAPSEQELYPHQTQDYRIELPALQNDLCGRVRPGHFRGAATVVNKLLNIVSPDVACFGKKDYQQLTLIRGMVADLNMNVRIVPVDIARAEDGLALSSRNAYLSAAQRKQAPQLHRALQSVAEAITAAQHNDAALTDAAARQLQQYGWVVDYIEIRRADTLAAAQPGDKDLVVLGAARLGSTRLIDNIEIHW